MRGECDATRMTMPMMRVRMVAVVSPLLVAVVLLLLLLIVMIVVVLHYLHSSAAAAAVAVSTVKLRRMMMTVRAMVWQHLTRRQTGGHLVEWVTVFFHPEQQHPCHCHHHHHCYWPQFCQTTKTCPPVSMWRTMRQICWITMVVEVVGTMMTMIHRSLLEIVDRGHYDCCLDYC